MLGLQLFARHVCGPGAGQRVLSGLVGAAHRTTLSFGSPWPVTQGWCGRWGGHCLPGARGMGALVLILAHAAWSLRPWHCILN